MNMTPDTDYTSRLAIIRKAMKRKKLDGFLVTDITNIRYLTGFSGSAGFLFITRKAQFFGTDFRYQDQSGQEVKGWDIVIERGNRIKTIQNLCSKTGTKKIGFESSASYEFWRQLSRTGLTAIPTDRLIEKLRTIKSSSEIELIKKAVLRAEQAFTDMKPFIREGARERVLASRLFDNLRSKGCRNIPFEIIVASGARSALPHAKPSDKKLQKGDLVIIDWGGEADGYFSDMTRTFLIAGKDVGKQKELYEVVLAANIKAIASVAPDTQSKEIDGSARTLIRNAGYSKQFGHGTGHGVGLQVHELPRISWNRNMTIRENMVLTIEPGIYAPGFGGVRIEDLVLVGKEKAEVLTTLPKNLEIL